MGMITWSPCTFFTDTHCVVKQKWSKLLKKQGGGFQNNFSDDFQEGRLVYEAEKPRVRQDKIFGQKKLWNNPEKKTSSYNFVDDPGVKRENRVFAGTASDFGVTKFFAHDEREDSDNEVWPGKHEKEAFEVIVKLMENEDVSEEESAENDDNDDNVSDKSSDNDETFHGNNNNILKENILSETHTLTNDANVIDKVNVEGEQKKENNAGNISRKFLFIFPLLIMILAILLLVTCRRKHKSKNKLGTPSGWSFLFSSSFCHSLNSTSTQVESDKVISWTTHQWATTHPTHHT
jgi:hypothetical protein